MHDKYEKATKDPNFFDTAESIEEYVHWRIIGNSYPYDAIASVHHMLIPNREFASLQDMTLEEAMEFSMLYQFTLSEYDSITLNTPKNQSFPQRLHFHLLILRVV